MMLAHAIYNHEIEEFLTINHENVNYEIDFTPLCEGGKYMAVGVDLETQELSYVFHEIISILTEREGEFNAREVSLIPIYEMMDDITFDFHAAIPLSEILVVDEGIQNDGH